MHYVRPHFANFGRQVKMPKLYMTDVGLAAALMGICNESQVDATLVGFDSCSEHNARRVRAPPPWRGRRLPSGAAATSAAKVAANQCLRSLPFLVSPQRVAASSEKRVDDSRGAEALAMTQIFAV